MIDKEKASLDPRKQWVKFLIVLAFYLAFLVWVRSWLGLVVVPFIYDVYITKKIKWQWWRDSVSFVRGVMSWVDALVFALVAVYFINLFFFQNYVIPSSSLEKSLLTGDYLFVSKMSYGPRKPQTPLTMPLTQHTMPFFGLPSYIEWPQWKYERVKGFGHVKQGDIVVFNYPSGDTLCSAPQHQAEDFYRLAYGIGEGNWGATHNGLLPDYSKMTPQQRRDFFARMYADGRRVINSNRMEYGDVITRPTDRRENYVKRCVGLPGQTFQIKNRMIFTDGHMMKEPENVQYSYFVRFRGSLPLTLLDELGVSQEDIMSLNQFGYLPLTKTMVKSLRQRKDLVESVTLVNDPSTWDLYPLNGATGWTRDNYGPVWIPKKGATLKLTMQNIAIYERPIRVYEGNDLQVRGGRIFINGKEAKSYTFKMDYYFMMGDNRHNSLDSRYWGFVPEDHIVGKPIFIWWSHNPDKNGFSGIRWNRLFSLVDNIK